MKSIVIQKTQSPDTENTEKKDLSGQTLHAPHETRPAPSLWVTTTHLDFSL
jgi:hypothetical protein